MDWTGLDWTGLGWTGLDWTGLDWTCEVCRWGDRWFGNVGDTPWVLGEGGRGEGLGLKDGCWWGGCRVQGRNTSEEEDSEIIAKSDLF